jgi:hypothetical protein
MSIASLCTGDTVIKETAAHSIGAAGGDTKTWSGTTEYDCLVQTEGLSSTRFAARGEKKMHFVFFSSDVSLTVNNRLKWTVKAGATLAVAIYLRVLDYYSEGRPGEDLLWIAECEMETGRREGN